MASLESKKFRVNDVQFSVYDAKASAHVNSRIDDFLMKLFEAKKVLHRECV